MRRKPLSLETLDTQMFQEKEPGLSSQQTMSLPEALKPESRQEGWETGSLVKLPKICVETRGREAAHQMEHLDTQVSHRYAVALTHFSQIS